ncbi:MAG: DUF1190 domain-containing protein [Pseudomonadota bacterium]
MTETQRERVARRRYAARTRRTLTVGTIAAAGLTVAACDSAPDGDYFVANIDQCRDAGFSQVVCENEFSGALAEHSANAPRFDEREACEAEFGVNGCNEQRGADGQSFFMPLFTGFLVGQALGRITSYGAYQTYRTNNVGYTPTPIYRDRSGNRVTVSRPSGSDVSARPVTRPVNVNTRTVSRQGFGGRSSSRGWGG